MKKKRWIWMLLAAVLAAAVIAAVLLIKGKSDGGGKAVVSGGHDKLLVSITDKDLMTKYYEDGRVLYEESFRHIRRLRWMMPIRCSILSGIMTKMRCVCISLI